MALHGRLLPARMIPCDLAAPGWDGCGADVSNVF